MKVLILEDEMLLSMQMEMLVAELGFGVEGPYAAVGPTLKALQGGAAVDCALLDINLRGETSWAVADALAARGVPFALTSGSSASDMEPRFAGRPVFMKPVEEARVKRFLTEIAAARTGA
jgi:CheY-like chemotaxis protein